MAQIFNTSIEKNESSCIEVAPSIDFTGWSLLYLAKSKVTDEDDMAKISIVPELKTITEDTISGTNTYTLIDINFSPDDSKQLKAGTLLHSLRAISSNNQTVITIFNGTLTVTDNLVKAP